MPRPIPRWIRPRPAKDRAASPGSRSAEPQNLRPASQADYSRKSGKRRLFHSRPARQRNGPSRSFQPGTGKMASKERCVGQALRRVRAVPEASWELPEPQCNRPAQRGPRRTLAKIRSMTGRNVRPKTQPRRTARKTGPSSAKSQRKSGTLRALKLPTGNWDQASIAGQNSGLGRQTDSSRPPAAGSE